MAKIAVADTLMKVVDTSIQLCGARGYSKDTLLEWFIPVRTPGQAGRRRVGGA